MRLIVTSDSRFSLARMALCGRKPRLTILLERYLRAFDSVRIVARAKLDREIDSNYRAVAGPGVDNCSGLFLSGSASNS